MRARIVAETQDKTPVTITITATLEEWRQINEQLVERWPSWQLSRVITAAMRKFNECLVDVTEVAP
jgi:hypothetical protein